MLVRRKCCPTNCGMQLLSSITGLDYIVTLEPVERWVQQLRHFQACVHVFRTLQQSLWHCLVFTMLTRFWVLEGESNFLSTIMESTKVLYAGTTILEIDLQTFLELIWYLKDLGVGVLEYNLFEETRNSFYATCFSYEDLNNKGCGKWFCHVSRNWGRNKTQ